MRDNIQAVLFDMGGTLRVTNRSKPDERLQKLQEMLSLLKAEMDVSELDKLLTSRSNAFKVWSDETLVGLNETDLWTLWMLPDWPIDLVRRNAKQLNRLWRDSTGTRIVVPEAKEVILELFRRGYRLGIVSNTLASDEVPHALSKLEISGCFDAVLLSCDVGIRKPDPSFLSLAAERIGIPPANCAYIGNNPDKDVAAAVKAGFGQTVIIRHSESAGNLSKESIFKPDYLISNLNELLNIFPRRTHNKSKRDETKYPKYDASLSTMWAKNNFPLLSDFFVAAERLGFSKIELNHQMNSELLSSVDLRKYVISSIHEPCPADISMETLKDRDWLISSVNEDFRQRGVEAVKRSIDLAESLAVRTLVVHAGMVSVDMTLENKLRSLFQIEQKDSAEYLNTRKVMKDTRAGLSGIRLEAVIKSLKELLDYAGRFKVRLGLENRYHFFDIPIPGEMSILLDLADADRIGVIYDVGHAQALDRLGFFNKEEWLKRFGNRIYGTHIHDVIGITDHYAPGLGEVDYALLAKYLPKDAFRTLEVMSFNSPEQIKNGLQKLVDIGCIDRIQ